MKLERGMAYLTAEEMAGFDRAAVEEFGISELVLMENAGAAVARVARMMLGGDVSGKRIQFLVGNGNNGGDGLAAARHLANWGADPRVLLSGDPAGLKGLPAKQLAILRNMGVDPAPSDETGGRPDLIVDSLFGYSLKGDPREPSAGMIRRANSTKVRILGVDLPSGLDATTGSPGEPCIVADTTVTLGLPKAGFLDPQAKGHVGALYLADLSFPRPLYARYSVGPIFEKDTLLRLW